MAERALHLFLYVGCDAALRARVDGEYASIRTAFDVPEHSTGTLINGSFEDLCFPAVQECAIESISGSVAVGEHERLLGVQSFSCVGVEFGCVPMNLDSDLGEGYRIRGVCASSIGWEGDVGFVIMGIEIFSVPAVWESNLGPEPTQASNRGESVMTRGLSQRVEA